MRGCIYLSMGLFLFVSVVFLLNFVVALDANFSLIGNSGPFYNFATNNTVNVSVGSTVGNISRIVFSFQTNAFDSDNFVLNTNGTDASSSSFYNITNGTTTYTINLTFSNNSATPLINANVSQRVWFNFVARRISQSSLVMTVNATGLDGTSNSTTITFFPAFTFTGYILNETGCSTCWQNGTNVTIYGIVRGNNGPSTATSLASTLTNASGYFRLANINASTTFNGYKLETIYYNFTDKHAEKVGSIMPEFPAMMYYGGGGMRENGEKEFDMSLNGGTFYLQSATTVNISANNGTTQVSFGYELIDQTLGFPISSSVQEKVTNKQIVVPAGRGYVVSFFRMPSFIGASWGYLNDDSLCGGTDLMNDSHCPTPPKSYSISAGSATAGAIIQINQSLTVRKVTVSGCVNVASGANNSAINITDLKVKMLPWQTDAGSFVPPSNADDGSTSATSDISYYKQAGCYANYTLSLLNQTGYMIEIYAKNASGASVSPGGANNLAGFQNITARDNQNQNITLYRLAGNYVTSATSGVSVNTSMFRINILNSTGGAVTTNVNANLKIKNSVAGIGTVYYIVDGSAVSNGVFYIPVLNNSNYAKVMIFSQNSPPRETKLNLSAPEANITIASMNQDKGFRKFRGNGSLETTNTTTTPISMRFLRTSDECDIPNAPQSCVITEMNASSFNPLKAMLAGKVNMEIKITSTNVSLIFKDYDMLSAKQPPMESVLDQNASGRSSSGSNVQETWNFGSFAPSDSYANVTVVIPFSDSISATNYLNESDPVNVSIPLLYDENSVVVWNKSRGDTNANLSDDFQSYNNSFYRGMLENTGGIQCSNTSITAVCHINITNNYIEMNVPHFSTIGASVSGTTIASNAGSSSSSSSSGSSSGGGITSSAWTATYKESDKELTDKGQVIKVLGEKQRVEIKVNGEIHNVGVVALTNNSATINISSDPQQATLIVGETKKFEINGDEYYDISVTLNSILNSKANVTILAIREKKTDAPNNTIASDDIGKSDASTQGGSVDLGLPEKSTGVVWKWIIGGIVVLILICLIVYYNAQSNALTKKVRVRQS